MELRAGAAIARSLPCAQCGYDLRGLPVMGRCPECGLDAWESVQQAVDPSARRLPELRNPHGVGDGLVWLVFCLNVATLLLVARPLALHFEATIVSGPRVAGWTPPWLTAAAAVVLLTGLWAVWKLAPPRGREASGAVWSDIWLAAAGLVMWAATALTMWRLGIPAPERLGARRITVDTLRETILLLLLVGAVALTMLALRGILGVIGSRSREYRTARGGRQGTTAMIVAALGVGLGEVLRLVGTIEWLEGLLSVGAALALANTLMLVVGMAYLLMNAWWIRRSLRRQPLTVRDYLTPEVEVEREEEGGVAPPSATRSGEEGTGEERNGG